MSAREINVSFGGGLKVDARIRDFVVRTDQPVQAGGDGSAPSPFDLFLASLATCAGYYVIAFCRERAIAVDGIRLTMTGEKAPGSKLIEKIGIRIDLPRGFPEKYKSAVVKAAESCTVKAHLQHPPVIEVVAAIGD
jgi:putative redox protein